MPRDDKGGYHVPPRERREINVEIGGILGTLIFVAAIALPIIAIWWFFGTILSLTVAQVLVGCLIFVAGYAVGKSTR